MVIKGRISQYIRGAILDCAITVRYLEKVESQFSDSSKAYPRTLIKRLFTEKYFGGGFRYHILRMNNMATRLKHLDLAVKDGFLIYLIFNSIPKEFDTFEVNYNSINEMWTLEKFMAMCVQDEERIKCNTGGDSVNMVEHHQKKRNYVFKPHIPKNEVNGKAIGKPRAKKDQCKWCLKRGHYQKNRIKFFKHLNREGGDHIMFIEESPFVSYAKSIWWIDSCATIYVVNSL
jgi:hypothetical protein